LADVRAAARRTYGCDGMVEKLDEARNVRELEDGDQASLVALELVLHERQEADQEVCCSQASKTNESLLANANPWRVADTKEDGLADVRITGLMMELMTYVIILLAILGKESSGGRHCEDGNVCVIFREVCSSEPKL